MKRDPMTYRICPECETAEHCRRHGCIPKTNYWPREAAEPASEPIPRADVAVGWVPYLGLAIAVIGAVAAYLLITFSHMVW
jgi:hypothetical protein